MSGVIQELKRAAYVMFKDGWQNSDLAARAGLEILGLREQVKKRDAETTRLQAEIAEARREAVAAIDTCPVDEGSAIECIESIVRAVIELGDRYRFISNWRTQEHREPRERVTADWAVLAIRSLMLTAIEQLSEGRMSDRDAERLVTRIVVQGLSPVRRNGAR